jgi:quercetin dioxygenase-like cupin family protein
MERSALPYVSVDGIFIRADEGEQIPRGQRHHRVLAEVPELEVIELRFGPDIVVEPHVHPDHVDSFYVLEGEAEFVVGDDVATAGPGTWVAAPIGTVHGFRNAGDGELRMLNIHAPNTGFTQRLRQQ